MKVNIDDNDPLTLINYDMKNCLPYIYINNNVTYKHVYIFNGNCWNGGESDISYLLAVIQKQIETFCFWPNDTKGSLVRPLYHLSIREGVREFLNLRILGISSRLYKLNKTPKDYGWKTPNLISLIVMIDKCEVNTYSLYKNNKPYLAKLLTECPNLEKIYICAKEDTIQTSLNNILYTLSTPYHTPWEIIRLIWISHYSGIFSLLSKDVIKIIMVHLNHGWI